jgi:hypothetical protein
MQEPCSSFSSRQQQHQHFSTSHLTADVAAADWLSSAELASTGQSDTAAAAAADFDLLAATAGFAGVARYITTTVNRALRPHGVALTLAAFVPDPSRAGVEAGAHNGLGAWFMGDGVVRGGMFQVRISGGTLHPNLETLSSSNPKCETRHPPLETYNPTPTPELPPLVHSPCPWTSEAPTCIP